MVVSNWDVVVEFTGEQAAALVVGLDPASSGYTRTTSTPIYERMKQCYEEKTAWLLEEMSPYEEYIRATSEMLASTALDEWESAVEPDKWRDFCKWSKDVGRSGFEAQRFTRSELTRWLKVLNVTPVYRFDLTADAPPDAGVPPGVRGSARRWTPKMKEQLKKYRTEHGTKAAAQKFEISEARVRALLPAEKSKPKGYSAFNSMKT